MISVLKTVTITALPNLGTVISEWVTSGLLNNAVMEYLWNMLIETNGQYSKEDIRAALQLLKFIGMARPSLIEKNMKLIVDVTFGSKGMEDVDLVIIACYMLAEIGNKPILEDDENPPARVCLDEPMWAKLMQIIEKKFFFNNVGISGLIQATVELIFKVSKMLNIG